ncbi:LysR family transcriptional regulator [Desulfovibrio gilichinskyi]|uniref:Transcriptional regulator, LysR family n=1 Tax=Desulfovibrio gilichinskyi TaxID=1519643 RepID=A0A1X7C9Z3_9BACT|nr:LysR family transcriptional regulator [Desulfovibrio gilichinskyi]SME92651.1 transcriptional regulator, LysR family [Desulfovibrio gilichinskyi]
MELYQLVSFVVVAEEGNMTRAATRLNLSQPAVSAQVKSLEEELCFPLFQRTSKGMKLTQEGVILKTKVDIVLRDVDDLNNEVEKMRGNAFSKITLGVNTDPGLLRLKDIYKKLTDQYPDISLTVQESMSWDVVGKLNSKKIDLGFSYIVPHDDRIDAQLLGEIDLTVVGPEAWRSLLDGKTEKDLAAFPWVWTSEHCPLNMILTEFFESIKEQPVKAIVVDQEAAILKLVSDGVGLSVMPSNKVKNLEHQYGVFSVAKLNKRLKLYILCLKQRKMNHSISIFLDVIKDVWRVGD